MTTKQTYPQISEPYVFSHVLNLKLNNILIFFQFKLNNAGNQSDYINRWNFTIILKVNYCNKNYLNLTEM